MDELELIRLLEEDMRKDISSIDLTPEQEEDITCAEVKGWYLETEKLIRVLGNILSVPMTQAINQLRYAGHHVLKAVTDGEVSKPNLIEAYKHCKRATYDALDFYVYRLNEIYRVVMPGLDGHDAIELEKLLREHIELINSARVNNSSRIKYYEKVHSGLIHGLTLVGKVNDILRKSGISRDSFVMNSAIVNENNVLKQHIVDLKNENETLEKKMETRFNKFVFFVSLVIALAPIIGLMVANALIPTSHSVSVKTEKQLELHHSCK
jgi:hypothetical protein